MKDQSKHYWNLIGDIHGELEALKLLLENLGYREEQGVIAFRYVVILLLLVFMFFCCFSFDF